MLRLLFTTEDNSKQLTVITDGYDGQLNVFVTENVIGDVDYYKSIGIVIEAGMLYNIGKFKEWAYNAAVRLIAYPEGLNENAEVLIDIREVYEYKLTTEEPTLNFSATGGQDMCVVTSSKQLMKNGQPEGAEIGVPVTFVTSSVGFTVNVDGQVIASENPTDQERTGVVIITQVESGKTIEIQLIQAASVITYENSLTVQPTELSFTGLGGIKTLTVVSRKNKLVNGKESGSFEKIDTDIELAGIGFSYLADGDNFDIVAEENTAETARSGKATISQSVEGGKSVEINLSQDAAEVTYEYICSVDPTSLSFIAAGETKVFGVTATKQKKVNGSNSGAATVVNYTTVVTGDGFTKGSTEYSVIAAENTTTNMRTGTAVVTTAEGDKSATVSLSQVGITA